MKYLFIANHQGAHSVEMMASTLGVTRSGYYAWKSRGVSNRQKADKELVQLIKRIHSETKCCYGSPRLTKELGRRGKHVGHNHVARLIAENGLAARRKKKFRITTASKKGQWIAENLLRRRFNVSSPNRTWVSDITYIATAEGWLYLAIIIDLFSRRVVGWSMGTRINAQLIIRAFLMAITRRQPPRGLVFHSDRGSQYADMEFRRLIREHGMRQSMSRRGNCWDNACAESFFNSLKTELIGKHVFTSRDQAQSSLFEYMEVFYNRQRLHSTLDYLTPDEYENKALEASS